MLKCEPILIQRDLVLTSSHVGLQKFYYKMSQAPVGIDLGGRYSTPCMLTQALKLQPVCLSKPEF